MRFAKTVSIGELKRSLSSLVDEAAAGARILITKLINALCRFVDLAEAQAR